MIETHPAFIYGSIIVGLIILIAQAFPKILGPLGKSISEWATTQRERRVASGDADISDLMRQVDYLTKAREEDKARHDRQMTDLQGEFADHRRLWAERETRWRKEWNYHRRWDYNVQEALLGHDPPFDLAPPFMTPDPITDPEGMDLNPKRGDPHGHGPFGPSR